MHYISGKKFTWGPRIHKKKKENGVNCRNLEKEKKPEKGKEKKKI
jgi:hypothetical protein